MKIKYISFIVGAMMCLLLLTGGVFAQDEQKREHNPNGYNNQELKGPDPWYNGNDKNGNNGWRGDKHNQNWNEDTVTMMHMLMREHAVVGGIAFTQNYDQSEELNILREKVNDNTNKLTQLMGRVKGEQNKERFRELWQWHINVLLQYSDAVRENNEEQKNAKREELNRFVDEISEYLKSDQVSAEELREHFRKHGEQEIAVIDHYASGDYKGAMRVLVQGAHHADMMAEVVLRTGNWQ